MSQFSPAFAYLMAFEDSRLQYADVPDAGGRAISGINSLSFPDQYAVIVAIPQGQRGPSVAQFYLDSFWTPMQAGGIESQDVANRYFDAGVNMGAVTACRLLQNSVNLLRPGSLISDGKIGPMTLEAANGCETESLLAAFRSLRMAHYQAIVDKNPDKAVYMPVWEKRAEA